MCVRHASLLAACLLLLPIAQVQAASFPDNAEVWMDLTTGELHPADETRLRSGPRISGRIWAGLFKPTGPIEYSGVLLEPDPRFPRGWLELATGTIRRDDGGPGPRGPFLLGRIDPRGLFLVHPTSAAQWNHDHSKREPPPPPPIEYHRAPIVRRGEGATPATTPAPSGGRFSRDLEIYTVRIDRAEIAGAPDLISGIRLTAEIGNAGRETWGYAGHVDVTSEEPGNSYTIEAHDSADVPSGLRAGWRSRVELHLSGRVPGHPTRLNTLGVVGHWQTITVTLTSESDENPANNRYQLRVLFDSHGRVSESELVQSGGTVRVPVH